MSKELVQVLEIAKHNIKQGHTGLAIANLDEVINRLESKPKEPPPPEEPSIPEPGDADFIGPLDDPDV